MPSVVDHDHTLINILENWENPEFITDAGKQVPARNTKAQRKKKTKIKSDLLLAKNPKNAYPVYQLLKKSERYSKEELLAAIGYLSETDTELKTSSKDPKLILERLILKLCHRQLEAKQG
jgi:DNA polymerase-3 subunit delta